MNYRKRFYRGIETKDISGKQLISKIIQGAILLDVRSNQEFNEGHIQGAINIPEYEINTKIEKEIPDKQQLIVIYCQYGERSKRVYMKMKKLGYNNIYNLYGGLDSL